MSQIVISFPGPMWLVITSPYGWRWGRMHRGTDYGSPNLALYHVHGSPIFAPFPGSFHSGYEKNGAGNWIWVTRGGIRFKAFHLKSFAVEPGAWVQAGDLIGWADNTGASTGDHDHWEIWIDGRPVDPAPHIERARSTPPTPQPPPEDELMGAEANLTAAIQASEKRITDRLGVPEGTTVIREIDGVELELSDDMTEAGWSGREYLVGIEGEDPVYEIRRTDEAPYFAKVHIRGAHTPGDVDSAQGLLSLLVKAGRNPHVLWVDPQSAEALELAALPTLEAEDEDAA